MTKQKLFFSNIFVSTIDCANSSNRLNLYHLWLFFFFCYWGPNRGGRRAVEEIERKRERCAVERERVILINFLGLEISIEKVID